MFHLYHLFLIIFSPLGIEYFLNSKKLSHVSNHLNFAFAMQSFDEFFSILYLILALTLKIRCDKIFKNIHQI